MRELQRKLEHDIKLKEFFAIKGNTRVNAELEAREENRKQLQQEMADRHLTNLQDIIKKIQVSPVHIYRSISFEILMFQFNLKSVTC